MQDFVNDIPVCDLSSSNHRQLLEGDKFLCFTSPTNKICGILSVRFNSCTVHHRNIPTINFLGICTYTLRQSRGKSSNTSKIWR